MATTAGLLWLVKMHPSLVPPRFQVHDVKGDGNCFYYAVLSGMNRFRYREREKDADALKKLLSDYLKASGARRAFDSFTLKGLESRLRKPRAWAEEAEIKLTADFLDACIFVFKPLPYDKSKGQRWSLSSYVPAEFRDICGHAGRALSYGDILETYFCQDPALCGPNTIFLLNVHENHYAPLQRLRRPERRSEFIQIDTRQTRDCRSHQAQRSCDSDTNCMWVPSHLLNLATRVKHGGVCNDIRHLLR
jgi:hypothetical protein